MIGSLQLAIQGNRSGATTITTPSPESLNLVRSIQLSLPGSQSTQHSRSCSTVISTPLIDRFFLCLCLIPIRIVVFVVSFKTANHGSICDSSPPWRWAYDYFWLCVGAYSSDWSSAQWLGTSAPLILTHDPSSGAKALTVQQTAQVTHQHSLRESL